MIVDTSALYAIVTGEAEAASFVIALDHAPVRRICAAALVETNIALSRLHDPAMRRDLELIIEAFGIRIEPFTEKQARIASDAWRDFGRGSGHPAKLNFGDCLTYALAIDVDESILFKGDDFPHTGVRSALS